MTDAARPVIAVLGGAGHEGSGIAARLARAGYPVIIGSRDADRAATAADALAGKSGGSITGASNAEAAQAGAIVFLAVPYSAQQALADEVRAALEGKILIDVTAPLVPPKVARVQLPEGGSAVEALQKRMGEGVRVVAAFQNVAAHQLADLDNPINCDVLVSGDDEAAREETIALCAAMGITAYHAGPLANSAAAEALTSVLISINRRYKVAHGAGIRITGIGALDQ